MRLRCETGHVGRRLRTLRFGDDRTNPKMSPWAERTCVHSRDSTRASRKPRKLTPRGHWDKEHSQAWTDWVCHSEEALRVAPVAFCLLLCWEAALAPCDIVAMGCAPGPGWSEAGRNQVVVQRAQCWRLVQG